MALHWYGVDPQLFIQYLQLWYNTFQKPIWVTEFACQVDIYTLSCFIRF